MWPKLLFVLVRKTANDGFFQVNVQYVDSADISFAR